MIGYVPVVLDSAKSDPINTDCYLEDPEEAINCMYEEIISPLYNMFNGPMQAVPIRDIKKAEELYAAYHKSHHIAAKLQARK